LHAFLFAGRTAPASEIQRARRILRSARAFVDRAFADVDVLLTLAAPGEAPAGLTSTGDPVFNKLASVSGCPAVGLPAGRGEHGPPLGIQLIAPAHADQALVRVATSLTDGVGLAARPHVPEEDERD
jgi:Asp-tRNA(Asn)/Glu-tRNA(Gln) amidotransferase A subunit family amidase